MSENNEKRPPRLLDFREAVIMLVLGLVAGIVFQSRFQASYGFALTLCIPVVLFAVSKGFRHGALSAVVAAAIYGTYLLVRHLVGQSIGREELYEQEINLGVIVASGFVPGIIMEFFHFRRSEPYVEETTIVETFVPDEETGLYNFKSFRWMLRGEMKRVKRYNSPMSLVFFKLLNVDEFRKRYDYSQEVLLIKDIGQHLRSMLREADYVGKYSDNEIGVVLPETGTAGVNIVCNRFTEGIGQLRTNLKKSWSDIELGFEMSRANFPKDAGNLEELIDVIDSRYEPLK
jgi:diguanylate cyclase (GGDEF)-like protein